MFYHIGEGKAWDASLAYHGNESLDDKVRIEEVPRSAVGQYGCNKYFTIWLGAVPEIFSTEIMKVACFYFYFYFSFEDPSKSGFGTGYTRSRFHYMGLNLFVFIACLVTNYSVFLQIYF